MVPRVGRGDRGLAGARSCARSARSAGRRVSPARPRSPRPTAAPTSRGLRHGARADLVHRAGQRPPACVRCTRTTSPSSTRWSTTTSRTPSPTARCWPSFGWHLQRRERHLHVHPDRGVRGQPAPAHPLGRHHRGRVHLPRPAHRREDADHHRLDVPRVRRGRADPARVRRAGRTTGCSSNSVCRSCARPLLGGRLRPERSWPAWAAETRRIKIGGGA